MIWAMGANHVEPEKLQAIIKRMDEEYHLLHTPYIMNKKELDRPIFDEIGWAPNFMYDKLSYVAEEKFDGFDYLYNELGFVSRSPSTAKGNEGNPVIKTGNVSPFIREIMKDLRDDFGVDAQGEIYIPGGTSDTVNTIMGCAPDEAQRRIIERENSRLSNMQYIIMDIRKVYGQDVMSEPWYVRRALLEHVMREYLSPRTELSRMYVHKHVRIPDILIGRPQDSFSNIVKRGGEGLVIKNTKAIYAPGKKPANTWIKAKKSFTMDVVILDLDRNGTGKNADLFRSLIVGIFDGKEWKELGTVHSGISDELRRAIHDNWPKHKGLVIEIEGMEFTGKAFRHGRFLRFRTDKTPLDCHGEYQYKEEII